MKINRITYPAQGSVTPKKSDVAFGAKLLTPVRAEKLKETLTNCGMLAAIIGISAWLVKLFKSYPPDESVFLNDGTYLGEAYEPNELI